MPRITRAALIQASNALPDSTDLVAVKQAMIDKHLPLIAQAAEQGAQVCCLQEIFCGPYFCAEQDARWYETAEAVPDGPTITLMRQVAKEHSMILVVPIYEEAMTGVYYNTAAVIDEHGEYLGRYRKHHIPHCAPGFWEKFYFTPGNDGYPVFETSAGRIGVYICYDRHFPEGARALGLAGAEIAIAYTGLRPGEKLTEALFEESESPVPTSRDGILLAVPPGVSHEVLAPELERLFAAAQARRTEETLAILHRLVPAYGTVSGAGNAAATATE